jgi:hypothetical protein
VATASPSIREAFVLCVRLALDRVRELAAVGALAARRPDAETPDELVAQVRSHEGRAAEEPVTPLAAQILREVLSQEDDPTVAGLLSMPRPGAAPAAPAAAVVAEGDGHVQRVVERRRAPRLPDAAAPSGRVWPPVEGRLVLHAASASAGTAHLRPDGSWQARVGALHVHSLAEHEFDELEDGREELLHWARLFAARSQRLSPQRCIVLAETGRQRWRLWQIVQTEESLRQRLSRSIAEAVPVPLAEVLHLSVSHLLEARDSFSADPPLPCRLGTVGALPTAGIYIGLLPPRSWVPPGGEFEPDDGVLIRREIEPLIRRALSAKLLDVPRILDALASERTAPPARRRAYEALAAMLIGE